eukprot:9452628-Alexandrium_andersonii.AAC.1
MSAPRPGRCVCARARRRFARFARFGWQRCFRRFAVRAVRFAVRGSVRGHPDIGGDGAMVAMVVVEWRRGQQGRA